MEFDRLEVRQWNFLGMGLLKYL